MTHRSALLLAVVAALAGCVAMPATPEPSPSAEPLRRTVPTAPRTTVLPTRAPNYAEQVQNVTPHLFRSKEKLYVTFFFNKRTGEQIFFEDVEFQVNYKLYPPDAPDAAPLVEKDVVMTADEQRFEVTLPASPAVTDTVRCVYAAGLPDGRRLTGDAKIPIAPDRAE